MAKGGQFEMAKLGYFNMGERGQLSWVFHLIKKLTIFKERLKLGLCSIAICNKLDLSLP
jgi:hypothetical protein